MLKVFLILLTLLISIIHTNLKYFISDDCIKICYFVYLSDLYYVSGIHDKLFSIFFLSIAIIFRKYQDCFRITHTTPCQTLISIHKKMALWSSLTTVLVSLCQRLCRFGSTKCIGTRYYKSSNFERFL